MSPEATAAVPCSFLSSECHGVTGYLCPEDLPRRSGPRGFLRQGWASLGIRTVPWSPPLQLATLTDTGSRGLEGRLMEKAAGNLLCNKTVHKRQMSIKGSRFCGRSLFMSLCESETGRHKASGALQGALPTAESLKEVAISRKPKCPPRSKV